MILNSMFLYFFTMQAYMPYNLVSVQYFSNESESNSGLPRQQRIHPHLTIQSCSNSMFKYFSNLDYFEILIYDREWHICN